MNAPVTSVALIDGIDVDLVAAAVTACPGVSALFGGRGDVVASYLPGRRVPGVEVTDKPPTVLIHVRSRWGVTAAELLAQISRAVTPLLHGKRLEVVVADIDDAEPPPPPPPPPVLPAAVAPVAVAPVAVAPVPVAPVAEPVRPPGSAPLPTPPTSPPAAPNFPTV